MTLRRIAAIALLLASFASACSNPEPAAQTPVQPAPPKAHRQYDARAFFETTEIYGASFSADESRILISSDATGVFNAWAHPIDGSTPTKLTDSATEATFATSYFPADDRLLFEHDNGGDELTHLFVRNIDGTSTDVTPGEKLKAQFAGWSGDDTAYFVATNERDEKYFDMYRVSIADGKRTLLFRNDGGYSPDAVSRDGRWLALGRIRNNADSDIYLFDAAKPKKKPVLITGHEGDVSNGVATFTADSAQLLFLSDAGSDFTRLWSHDLASAKQEMLLEAPWDVAFATVSRDGRWRVTGVNEDGVMRVTVRDTTTGQAITLTGLPDGDVSNVTISRSGKLIAMNVNTSTSPANLYVGDLSTGQCRRLTNSRNPAIAETDLVAAQIVRYPSFDGLQIPAVLYRPLDASASAKVPALVFVHGGPGGQCRPDYSADIQFLVNHGYAVLAVNNRGSSGYGRKFNHLDDRNHGEGDLQDCIHGRRYLETLDWVDGTKVGIFGGSYGGFMVVAALSSTPDAFDVGVDYFGVTNWLRTLESIPPWWEDFRAALYAELGDPTTDKERLTRISPLFHVDAIRKPMLVVQGANDPRVLPVESEELVAALRKHQVPIEYVVFPDEGHGFVKRANRITAAEATLKFLDQYLRAPSTEPAPAPAR